MDIQSYIESKLEEQRGYHFRLSRKYGKVKDRRNLNLTVKETKKGKYYYLSWYEGGINKRKYLGTSEKSLVKEIQAERFMRAMMERIEKNLSNWNKLSDYLIIDPYNINATLPKAYRSEREDVKKMMGMTPAEKWHERAVRIKADWEVLHGIPYKDSLVHKCADGNMVRSKSEVIIANALYKRNMLYVYEMPINVGGKTFRPDFAVYSDVLGKPVLWEHCGMLGDPEYVAGFLDKMSEYVSAGYTPCVDVLITFDTLEGHLDASVIEEIIDYKFDNR